MTEKATQHFSISNLHDGNCVFPSEMDYLDNPLTAARDLSRSFQTRTPSGTYHWILSPGEASLARMLPSSYSHQGLLPDQ